MATLKDVDDFLGLKRVAVVGVSRNPKDFTRILFRELHSRGYDVVPVHPNQKEVEGVPCYAHVSEIEPPVEGALLLTNPVGTADVVQECARAGIHRIWMYRAIGAGSVNASAVRFCQENDMSVVDGECPFMFLPHSAFPHRAHGFCRKLFGHYPS
jgi:predicted CoA-binding protein